MIERICKKFIRAFNIIFAIVLIFGLVSCKNEIKNNFTNYNPKVAETTINNSKEFLEPTKENLPLIDKDGTYTSKDEVALYIYTYKKLPKNFITKSEAKKLGWDNSKGNLSKVMKGKSIGGDVFGNYEKLLPVIKGRKYYECDIDFNGKKRNAKRIVYADDFDEDIGFIYYTDDHYKTFERLY